MPYKDPEKQREYNRKAVKRYYSTPEGQAARQAYLSSPEGKEVQRRASQKQEQSPQRKEYRKRYRELPQYKEYQREYWKTPGGKLKRRGYKLKYQYGMNIDEYNKLLEEQGGKCAICFDTIVAPQNLYVDHDHNTGMVRGILCLKCNLVLSRCNDSVVMLQAAIDYLQKPETLYKVKLGRPRISKDNYNILFTLQKGCCAICHTSVSKCRQLCADHNYTTGYIRGLLCDNCNTMLGYSRDSVSVLQEAIRYLEKYGGK